MLLSLNTQTSAQGRACHSKLGSRGRHFPMLYGYVDSLIVFVVVVIDFSMGKMVGYAEN